ncbi:MAG TPA: glycosyltransferase family 39 protein, partial [Candidatus Brocadiia bacterium]|nr:glycosyltransferase family 39 protein [Candidatus Brocadiia bacterium]
MSNSELTDDATRPRSVLAAPWFWGVVAAALAARLVYIAAGVYELIPDEAVHWQYSRRLDWCYYTKGPLAAWLMWLGCQVFGQTEFGIRVFSALCSAATLVFSVLLYERLRPGERRGVAGFLIVHQVVPLFVVGSFIMNVDSPLMTCWAAAMWAMIKATRDRKPGYWVVVALAIGVGLTGKMAMLFFPATLFTYLALSPQARPWLRRPGPWLATLGGLLFLIPQFVWNSRHGWIMFYHQAQKAKPDWEISGLLGPFEYVGALMGVVSPVLFVLLVIAFVHHWRQRRSDDDSRLILAGVLPVFLFYGALSFIRHVDPNWPAVMLHALFLGGALYWAPRWGEQIVRRWWWTAFAVGAVITFFILAPGVSFRLADACGLDPARLPMERAAGWRDVAAFAAKAAAPLRQGCAVVGRNQRDASVLAFYMPGQPWTY